MATPSQLCGVLTGLRGAAEFRRLMTLIVGRTPGDDSPLTAAEKLNAYLYEWLRHTGVLRDREDAVRWLCRMIAPTVRREADSVAAGGRLVLTVTDGVYATWTGLSGWLDLNAEKVIAELAEPGVTHVVCDAAAMYAKKERWLRRISGERPEDPDPSLRGTEGSGPPPAVGG